MTDFEEEIIEEIVEDGPRPGLLILDMSNDQMKAVAYKKDSVISNVAQLATSDFFHVCIDCRAEVPAFRAKQKGSQLVDELAEFDHINHIPKKQDSALSNSAVLEMLKSVGVTHVCVCGTSTDSSIDATVKDLVSNGFEIFVVKDAATSKNGKFGHDKGLRNIQSAFGDSVVVGIDDLLGEEEEIVEEDVVEDEDWVEEIVDDEYEVGEEVNKSPARRKPAYLAKGGATQTPAVDAKAEKARMSDAERLAARKKQVDAQRFAHIKQANSSAAARADPKRAAEIAKDTAEADEFSKNLPQNKADTSAAALSAPASAAAEAPAKKPSVAPAKKERNGLLCGLLCRKKKKDAAAALAPVKAEATPAPVAPAAASKPAAAAAPAPSKSGSAAAASKPAAAPAPAPSKSGSASAASKPTAAPAPSKSGSATAVPGGGAGQKTWIKPLPEGQKKTTYTPDGAQSQPLGVKKMVQSDAVQERIRGLQEGGISTVRNGPRKMKTPKIVTDTKETWDREGNITREITRYITEIDGTKRTEKEIVKIPAKK